MKKFKSIIAIAITIVIFANGFSIFSASAGIQDKKYSINRNGETYGNLLTAIYVGYESDLIEAIGINGVEGYVKSTDLNLPLPSSPSEAVKATKNATSRTINLYDKDGEEVIGLFQIDVPSVFSDTHILSKSSNDFEYGDNGYGTANGIAFSNYSGIRPIWRGVRGVTGIGTTKTGVKFPAGHVGVKIRIIKQSNGKLVRESDYAYNETSTTAFSAVDEHTTFLREQYYNLGYTRVHNGTDYWTYSTFQSPSVYPTLL